MADGPKSFFDTYANMFVAIGSIVGVLTLLFTIFTYWLQRREQPVSAQSPSLVTEKHSIKVVYAARVLATATSQLTKLIWRHILGLANQVWFAVLYYIPGIKYEVAAQPNVPEEDVVELRDSNVFFSERFADAFPAIKGLTAYTRTADIAHRLDILLRAPLCGLECGEPRGPVPIWWLRGMGNLHIYRWGHLKPNLSLMNNMELDIARIVAIPGVAYWQNFVYVECRALPQVGLYDWTKEELERMARNGHGYEEYAVYGHRIFNRQQYDDAGYEVRGRVKHFRHRPQLRIRHITPFNFVIAPAMSPVNVATCDGELDRKLRLCRENPAAVNKLAEWLLSLPKRSERR
jgi:hypothetical protein